MPSGLLNLALGLAIQVGSPGPSETPNFPAPANAYGRYGFEGSSEQRYPFDTQQSWVHGYFQDIPAYGGHHTFRPYNYKDVLSQSQTAAGWGERPTMPYAQQFWHKYQDQATMLKTSQAAPIWTPQMSSRSADTARLVAGRSRFADHGSDEQRSQLWPSAGDARDPRASHSAAEHAQLVHRRANSRPGITAGRLHQSGLVPAAGTS